MTVNAAGGSAHRRGDLDALRQYAMTGCFGNTYYVNAEVQLADVLALAEGVASSEIATLAIDARKRGFMKDMPALLCAILTARGDLSESVFSQVIDSGKMLRNYVQIVRSGVTGRRSFGTRYRGMVRRWLDRQSGEDLFAMSVGASPSLADIIRMVHPRPTYPQRAALYGYIIGKQRPVEEWPAFLREYERFKAEGGESVPAVNFQLLTSLPLSRGNWETIAKRASWQMTRMNLNTFLRHGVFESGLMVRVIADRLRDPELIAEARCFPYQLLAAYANVEAGMPREIVSALHDAMEIATESVPAIEGALAICVDVSGSMQNSVSGERGGATSKVRCIDAAALVASALLRKNPAARVIAFDTSVHVPRLEPRDTVLTNAKKLAAFGRGGTDCSLPLKWLADSGAESVGAVIMISDNESWAHSAPVEAAWKRVQQNNPGVRLVCLDITPNKTVQVRTSANVRNIGGFSDNVFQLMAEFFL